jgi:hypothetical protein
VPGKDWLDTLAIRPASSQRASFALESPYIRHRGYRLLSEALDPLCETLDLSLEFLDVF